MDGRVGQRWVGYEFSIVVISTGCGTQHVALMPCGHTLPCDLDAIVCAAHLLVSEEA